MAVYQAFDGLIGFNSLSLFLKWYRVSFKSSSYQRHYCGAQLVSMAQSTKITSEDVGSKPGFILLSSEDHVEKEIDAIKDAIDVIKAGKVIVVPTDTLYGFACDAWT